MLQPNFTQGSRTTWLTRPLAELDFCLYLTHKALSTAHRND